jgi:hypothetical protein
MKAATQRMVDATNGLEHAINSKCVAAQQIKEGIERTLAIHDQIGDETSMIVNFRAELNAQVCIRLLLASTFVSEHSQRTCTYSRTRTFRHHLTSHPCNATNCATTTQPPPSVRFGCFVFVHNLLRL